MSYLFSKKIKCLRCEKNYKGKKERNKKVYICSGYSNYGSYFCIRDQIDEDELIYITKKHLTLQKIDIQEDGQISDYIERIEIGNEGIKIYYTNNTQSILNKNQIIY